MKNQPNRYKDLSFKTGLWLILLSSFVFSLPFILMRKEDEQFGIFLINFAIAVFYFFMLSMKGTLKKGAGGEYALFLLLILLLISAYSLNRFLPVFESSVTWFSVVLVIVSAAYASLAFKDVLPRPVYQILTGIIGIGFTVFLYLTLYLLPIYALSIIGLILLGISIHSFVPLLFVLFTSRWVIRQAVIDRRQLYPFWGGVGVALIAIIVFSVTWGQLNSFAYSQYNHTYLEEKNELPTWTKVAQRMPYNFLTEKYLKANLVYSMPARDVEAFSFSMPSRTFDEARKHDPLVMIAALVNPVTAMDETERIKVLQYGYHSRHKTEDRLWNGEDLTTTNVVTNIRLWPQYRMAYTEKTITVANTSKESWRNNEEAIYTFHLPEGGVVTALSLWINDREEKGILTTKGKADSAYKQIVGVERHDPSVVHWQEGNTVSVRVFPVNAESHRVFKLGITAPLTLENEQLRYDNIYFEGPDAAGAKELVQVDWQGNPGDFKMNGFTAKGNSHFISERTYKEDWHLEFPTPLIANDAFHFAGKLYRVQEYKPERMAASFGRIYLDINESWTENEFQEVARLTENQETYAYDDGLIRLTDKNREEVFNQLRKNHFSLFPLYEIKDPANALLVTKSNRLSPNTSDLKESIFAKNLESWVQKSPRLKLLNLGNELSPYLKTLKEHRLFYYEQGDATLLKQLISGSKFAASEEDEHSVIVDQAGIRILCQDSITATASAAPDHLLRLFAYNHLMQQLKRGIYTNQEADTALVQEAQQAYVVTPLSSLIVLESAVDYERFNIKDSNNSLKNASLKSKGAVPEPHEWALIILAALTFIWLKFKDRIRGILMLKA